MLRGNGQAHMARAVLGIAALEHVGLLDYLARVAQKLGAVVGQRHAAIAARENGDAQLLLEVFDGRGKVRLRREQLARGGIDGAVFRDGDKVAKLLQCGHRVFPLRIRLHAGKCVEPNSTAPRAIKRKLQLPPIRDRYAPRARARFGRKSRQSPEGIRPSNRRQ